MSWIRGTISLVGLVLGGWMVTDGTRALVVGDYFTPASGDYAGQLGPWADLLRTAGVEPRAPYVKALFIVLGGLWLGASMLFFFRIQGARPALAGLAVLCLWYLPVGTILSAALLVLLWKSSRSSGTSSS